MDPKFIPGTPEYRAWIISQLPEGFDLSQLGIPGLDDPADHQAFSRLGSCQKVMVPSSSGGILSHGALTADGTAVFTVSQHGFIDKVSLAGDRAVATLVSPPLNEFGAPEPEMFRFCDLAVGESLLCVGK